MRHRETLFLIVQPDGQIRVIVWDGDTRVTATRTVCPSWREWFRFLTDPRIPELDQLIAVDSWHIWSAAHTTGNLFNSSVMH